MTDLTNLNDTYVAGLGDVSVNGLDGTDTLVVDYSSLTAPVRYYDWYGWRVWTDDSENSISAYSFERFNFTGGSEADDLRGADLADTLNGGGGNDVLRSGRGADLIDGGAGVDRWIADYSAVTQIVNITLLGGGAAAAIAVTNAQVQNVEALSVTTGGNTDTIDTQAVLGNDDINTAGGNDTVRPGLGVDTLNAGDGTDLLVLNYSTLATDVLRFDLGYGWMRYADDSGVVPTTSIDYYGVERFDITGGSGRDRLFGAGMNDTLVGGAGDDVLTGYGGVDVINGGDGTDVWAFDYSALSAHIKVNLSTTPQTASTGATISGIERLDAITGIGNDALTAKTGQYNDRFDTRDGNDTITSSRGRDWVNAGNGDDLLVMGWGAATTPIAWSDQGYGWYRFTDLQGDQIDFYGIDRFNLTGGSGADTLVGFGGRDTLSGGGGNDWLDSRAGTAVITGGAGTDMWAADLSAFVDPVRINTFTSQTTAQGGAASLSVKTVEGLSISTGAGDDSLNTASYATNDLMNTNDGSDTVAGGLGFDTTNGGNGVDLLVVNYSTRTTQVRGVDDGYGWWHYADNAGTAQVSFYGFERFDLTGGSADDVLYGAGDNDSLRGGDGNDILNGSGGLDSIVGGAGIDRWIGNYGGAVDDLSLTVSALGNGTLSIIGTTLAGVEQISLTTGSGADHVSTAALGGNDQITTNDGDDWISVGHGRDEVNAGGGNDTMVFDFTTSTTAVTTTDQGYGWWLFADTGGLNSVREYGVDNLDATGGSGNDRISSWGGADILRGGNGNDVLAGGDGVDTLQGGAGNDLMIGGGGGDALNGGAGTDRFKFVTQGEGTDAIADFVPGTDRVVVVSGNFAGLPVGTLSADRLYADGSVLPDNRAVFLYNSGSGALYFDNDGNGANAAVQLATLTGAPGISASDIRIVG